jgi:hypothetical protein
MPFQGLLRVVVYSVFVVGAEIPNSAPRLTWDRSAPYNIRTTPRHGRRRRVGTLKYLSTRNVEVSFDSDFEILVLRSQTTTRHPTTWILTKATLHLHRSTGTITTTLTSQRNNTHTITSHKTTHTTLPSPSLQQLTAPHIPPITPPIPPTYPWPTYITP